MTTAPRRLVAILAAGVAGYSRLMGEDEAGTARAVGDHRDAARPITLNVNYGFSPTATSTVTIFNDRFTSTPAVRCAETAVIHRQSGQWIKSTKTVILG